MEYNKEVTPAALGLPKLEYFENISFREFFSRINISVFFLNKIFIFTS